MKASRISAHAMVEQSLDVSWTATPRVSPWKGGTMDCLWKGDGTKDGR